MAKKNALTQGKKNKADEAARGGHLREALVLFKSACKLDPSDAEVWVKLSMIQKRLGFLDEAEASARRAVLLNPRIGFCHHALGVALHGQGRHADSIIAYRKAIELQPDFADSYYLLACAMHESGQLTQAIAMFERALALKPNFPEALGDLGAVLVDRGEVEQGAKLLAQALALQPGNAVVLSNMSNALRMQGKVTAALENYRHGLRLEPDSLDLIAGLAGLLEKTGELAEAKVLIERALDLYSLHPASNLVAAQLARREKRFQDAVDILERLRSQPLRLDISAEVELSLGQLYDQLDTPTRAYPLIVSGNEKKSMLLLEDEAGRGKYLERVALVSSFATPALALCSIDQSSRDNPAHTDPVFLIGFPRSGTTLLEQILDSHPSIQAMEEKGAVTVMVNAFIAEAEGREDALARLSTEQIEGLRQLYFDEVKHHIYLRPGSLLLDKLPLNVVNVPVIWRIFPNAKFILAIRHPCDASLSCHMQNFAVNEAMASFFSLDETVSAYAAVMTAWLKYVDLLPLSYHRVRYEDLIADIAGESQSLLEFLGVAWDDSVLQHTEHARKRGAINTPSYHQVVQPIYQHAKYRWKRYEREFAPVIATLQPFISYFGYEESNKIAVSVP